MSQLYTIGFTKKDARSFFEALKKNNMKALIDVRLNNVSQLAGYTKKNDIQYFLEQSGIEYEHALILAPTKEILDAYKKKEMTWEEYEKQYIELLNRRNVIEVLEKSLKNDFDKACLLCSESTAEQCHRRLAANHIRDYMREIKGIDIQIIHL